MQLISTNLAGNLHVASDTINQMGLADFVVALDSSGHNTIAVLKVPDDVAPRIRKFLGVLPEYQANPVPKRSW